MIARWLSPAMRFPAFASAAPRASALTLAGNEPLAENTYAEAFKPVPVESTISLPLEGATEIKHMFPPCSITIPRLGQNR